MRYMLKTIFFVIAMLNPSPAPLNAQTLTSDEEFMSHCLDKVLSIHIPKVRDDLLPLVQQTEFIIQDIIEALKNIPIEETQTAEIKTIACKKYSITLPANKIPAVRSFLTDHRREIDEIITRSLNAGINAALNVFRILKEKHLTTLVETLETSFELSPFANVTPAFNPPETLKALINQSNLMRDFSKTIETNCSVASATRYVLAILTVIRAVLINQAAKMPLDDITDLTDQPVSLPITMSLSLTEHTLHFPFNLTVRPSDLPILIRLVEKLIAIAPDTTEEFMKPVIETNIAIKQMPIYKAAIELFSPSNETPWELRFTQEC